MIKRFTYWKTIELLPGLTRELFNVTITTNDKMGDGMFDDVVAYVCLHTDFNYRLVHIYETVFSERVGAASME